MVHAVNQPDGREPVGDQEGEMTMECCARHPHEVGAALCRRCGDAWCRDCLVYAFGGNKPPFCMSCAMVAGGVRSAGARPPMPKKELRARMKAERQAAKAAAKAAREATTVSTEAALQETDWSSPWWEDRQPSALAD
jgi:hypothetical protein